MKFIRMVLERYCNKPMVIVDRGSWYRWALDRLGIEYIQERSGRRSIVERFFGYLKQRIRRL